MTRPGTLPARSVQNRPVITRDELIQRIRAQERLLGIDKKKQFQTYEVSVADLKAELRRLRSMKVHPGRCLEVSADGSRPLRDELARGRKRAERRKSDAQRIRELEQLMGLDHLELDDEAGLAGRLEFLEERYINLCRNGGPCDPYASLAVSSDPLDVVRNY